MSEGVPAETRAALVGRVAVVDGANRFVRWEDRRVVHEARLPHRTAHVLVFDRAGTRLLLQRRHREKLTHAGHWDLSCAGHVEEEDLGDDPDAELDRVYTRCAHRELREELGIDVAPGALETLGHFPPLPGVHYEELRLFRAVSEGPFVPQADEVEELRFVTREELAALVARAAATAESGAVERLTETLVYFAGLADARGYWRTSGGAAV